MTSAIESNKERIDWVDYAKGICIFAVVTLYATNYVEDRLQAQGWMHYFVAFAQPFRMPDFFLISGLFVGRVINRPLRSYVDSKILHFLYFYILWITLRLLLQDGAGLLGPQRGAILSDYFQLYLQPHGQLWFIYMLAVFFLTVRLLRKVPAGLVFAIAIALKLAEIETGWKLIDRFGIYFIFFYSGHVFAPQALRLAAWARENKGSALLMLAAWFTLNTLMVFKEWSRLPGMQLLLGYIGAMAILLISSLLTTLPWMRWLRYLGEHSIVVYLAFVIPLTLMRKLFIDNRLIITDIGSICLLMVAVSISGALLLHWIVRNTPMEFLFRRPRWASIAIPIYSGPGKNTASDQ